MKIGVGQTRFYLGTASKTRFIIESITGQNDSMLVVTSISCSISSHQTKSNDWMTVQNQQVIFCNSLHSVVTEVITHCLAIATLTCCKSKGWQSLQNRECDLKDLNKLINLMGNLWYSIDGYVTMKAMIS